MKILYHVVGYYSHGMRLLLQSCKKLFSCIQRQLTVFCSICSIPIQVIVKEYVGVDKNFDHLFRMYARRDARW